MRSPAGSPPAVRGTPSERQRPALPTPHPPESTQTRYLEAFGSHYAADPAVALLRACEARLVALTPLVPPLLDLGSGDGSFLELLGKDTAAVALDRRPRRARRAAGRSGYSAGVAGDAAALPFRDASFATVLANSSLEHMERLPWVLSELRRVLRPDGRLVLTVHNHRFASRMWFWPQLLRTLGRADLLPRYRQARLERLEMRNLYDHEGWRRLLAAQGLVLEHSRQYMGELADRCFERELVLARLGVWRAHLSSATRMGLSLFERLGWRAPRRWLGGWHARRLEPAYQASLEGEGTALFLVARREPEAAAPAHVETTTAGVA